METLESRLPSVYTIRLVQFMVVVCLFISLLYGQRELTILALLVLGITIGTNLWSGLSLSRIRCSSMVDKQKLFPGETLALLVKAVNRNFLPVWLQVVGLGLGVSGAYGTHVHAVVRNATIPSDSLHFTREDGLIHGALTPKDGFVEVPTSPGLGIELDMDAVERYRIG